jgi:hypothetical protein
MSSKVEILSVSTNDLEKETSTNIHDLTQSSPSKRQRVEQEQDGFSDDLSDVNPAISQESIYSYSYCSYPSQESAHNFTLPEMPVHDGPSLLDMLKEEEEAEDIKILSNLQWQEYEDKDVVDGNIEGKKGNRLKEILQKL